MIVFRTKKKAHTQNEKETLDFVLIENHA